VPRARAPFVVFGSTLLLTGIVGAWSPSLGSAQSAERVKESSSSSVPTLTPERRTTLQLRVLIYRNAQLELEAVLKDLQVPGYTIDLNTLAYVKSADPKVSP
jgi:hypothetical protein